MLDKLLKKNKKSQIKKNAREEGMKAKEATFVYYEGTVSKTLTNVLFQ